MTSIVIPTPYYEYFHSLPFQWNDIVNMEGSGNYTVFILVQGKRHVTSKTLATYQPYLPQEFVRIHKGCIINRRFLIQLDRKKRGVVLADGRTLKIARRRWQNVLAFFQK